MSQQKSGSPVVVGSADAADVAQIIGPHNHRILGRTECSVLVVRR
jgi:hypothetical protein